MCTICKGTGFVLAKNKTIKEPTIPYAFRCDCSTGRAKASVGIPLWGPRFERIYNPISGCAMEMPEDPKPEVQPAPPPATLAVTVEELNSLEEVAPW